MTPNKSGPQHARATRRKRAAFDEALSLSLGLCAVTRNVVPLQSKGLKRMAPNARLFALTFGNKRTGSKSRKKKPGTWSGAKITTAPLRVETCHVWMDPRVGQEIKGPSIRS